MGGDHVTEFLKIPEARVVAVCDVDDEHLSAAKYKMDLKYGDQGCATCRAFGEILSRRDIDAVTIALPGPWHALAAVQAARAGKDVYGEKPRAIRRGCHHDHGRRLQRSPGRNEMDRR